MESLLDGNNVAKKFANIMLELDSAEEISSALTNTICHLRREVEFKRQFISNGNRVDKSFHDEMGKLAEKGAKIAIDVLLLECEKKVLTLQIEKANKAIMEKKLELESLEKRNSVVDSFIQQLESYAQQRSLLSDLQTVKDLSTVVEEDPLEGVDLAEFALSQ